MEKVLDVVKILIKTVTIYFISLLIAEIIVILVHFPFGYDPMGNPFPMDILLIATYYGYIITIAFLIIFVKKISKKNLKDIGIDKNFKTIFKGIFLGILTIAIIILTLSLFKLLEFDGINRDVNYLMIILFFIGYFIQSFMEELICRGYLFHKIKEKTNIILATLIAFGFFSVFHFTKLFNDGILLGIIGCANLFLVSMIWFLLTLKDENIYTAVGFHFIWNFILFNIIGLNLSGLETSNSILKFSVLNEFFTGASYGIESSVVTTVILAIVLIVIGMRLKKKK